MKQSNRKTSNLFKKCLKLILCFYGFCVFVLLGLIACSHASFKDFFTTGKTSFFKDHYRNAEEAEKNIIIDASALSDNGGGITSLTKNIIKGLSKKRPHWNLFVIADPRNNFTIETDSPNVEVINVRAYCLTGPLLWLRSFLNFATIWAFEDQITQLLSYDKIYFNNLSCDLFFDPYAEFVVNDYKSVPKVSLIHDMLYRDMPDCTTVNIDSDCIQKNAKRILDSSQKIITVSEFSKRKILQYYQELTPHKINKSFIEVIPIKLAKRISNISLRNPSGAKEEFKQFVLDKFNLTQNEYIIYPSVVRPRKNHKQLIKAFLKYSYENNSNIKLVIAGTIHDNAKKCVYSIVEEECKKLDPLNAQKLAKRMSENVICTGFISNEELGLITSNSLAMVFPSTYEGFGMPVIEAMEAGVPVLCSNVTSLPEVAGDAAMFFDPYSVDEISRAIKMMVENKKLREHFIQEGYKRAKKYEDTDSMIDQYIEVFEKCMNK